MTKSLLVISGVYLAAIGLALLVVPAQFGTGAVPDDPSTELIALLRLLGGPFLGIAVLNWMSRNSEPASIRNTVILANLIGFAVVAGNDVVGVVSGHARDIAVVFLVVHAVFALLFAMVWVRAGRRVASGGIRRS
ncbi:hypothetical protein GOARA_038_00200 [Gordonia araii NBRC 100433]|uniref:DUF4345 domain-containing protein n=1 Tax=Gordonia araii NBRC 100433 TaxID=1073574 RepID=G7H0U8_9ACTN|nr:membrane protein [Gordonia araii]NNG99189.1 hypothetical protein [Gordonia araii NBRC 100433]GAB09473.1 hypothetical protein GOARA_038_00200 [Gordonia araii NBRC 100433]